MNPPLLQQGAALIGWELPEETSEIEDKAAPEDQLSMFLEQYPSLNVPKNDVVSAQNLPIAGLPAPVQPPIPPRQAQSIPQTPPVAPQAVAPQPVVSPPPVETSLPLHAHSWHNPAQENFNNNFNNNFNGNFNQNVSPWEQDNSPWNGTASTAIHAAPAVEYHPQSHPQSHWPGAQQEMPPAPQPPQQSVYAGSPAMDAFPVPAIEQTNFAPSMEPPPSAQIPPSAPPFETVPVHGTEMVARVGTHVILMGDILPKLRRLAMQVVAEQMKTMSEEQRAQIPPQEIEGLINMIVETNYPAMLEEQILFALLYTDYTVSRSKDEKDHIEGKMAEEFDRVEIPEMMKEFNVENAAALRRFLETQLGSSLEKERRLWIREQIARQWIGMSIQRAADTSTHEEMFEFYEKNQEMFTSPARVRWQEMVVLFSRHDTEQQAWEKIVWMGNQVALHGVPFEEIALQNSNGLTSSSGGMWDWTKKGDLASAELEQALFSQPIGHLSPAVIRSDGGLHIIRVLERHEARVDPFVEAQVKIRENIRRQREQRHRQEYIADLHRRIPTVIVKNRIDFNVNLPRTASAW